MSLLLLLLSCFSCVRLRATPWTAAYQASPGKNTGVGCHFLLQCMKVESESEVAQSRLTLSDPMDCSPPGSSIHGIFQATVREPQMDFLFFCWMWYVVLLLTLHWPEQVVWPYHIPVPSRRKICFVSNSCQPIHGLIVNMKMSSRKWCQQHCVIIFPLVLNQFIFTDLPKIR